MYIYLCIKKKEKNEKGWNIPTRKISDIIQRWKKCQILYLTVKNIKNAYPRKYI